MKFTNNDEAAKWTGKNSGSIYPNLTPKQKDILKKVIAEHMKGGVPLRDVVNAILKEFTPEIARLVAITEITRAYAEKEQKEGERLKKEWQDVPVIKIWTTCNDHEVCPICSELEGKEVEIDQSFVEGIFIPPAHPGCRCWIASSTTLAE